ncbi:uncharacterized protein ARMOST_11416 [Armillaria ostoyae]|uniref:Uncharacterized protein n=1 Tax=Armillaria ostoyae TaxID=47428 RepID=A0A284RH49_ARMOS|nr:uncharacterized protein ARMOST_11416 [Armillaria ostoyae]
MAQLIAEYSTQQSEESQSMEFQVKYYSNFDLTSNDVQDLGFECFSDTPWYSLQPPLVEMVVATVTELQTALISATLLLIERSTIYLVDPQQMYIWTLKGTNNIHLLNEAWTGLWQRLDCGEQFLYKYVNQYKLEAHSQSPASTDPRLYTPLERIQSLAERGAELLDEGEDSYPERPVNCPSSSSHRESKPSLGQSVHLSPKIPSQALEQEMERKEEQTAQDVTICQIGGPQPDTPISFSPSISLNVKTPYKDLKSGFFNFPYTQNSNASAFNFGPSISAPFPSVPPKTYNFLLVVEEEGSRTLEEREVTGMLTNQDGMGSYEEGNFKFAVFEQPVLPDKSKQKAPFIYPSAAHISPVPSMASAPHSPSKPPSEPDSSDSDEEGEEKVVAGHQLFEAGIHSLMEIFLLYLHHHHLVHLIMNQIRNQTILDKDDEGNEVTLASLVNMGEEVHKVIEENKVELVPEEGEVIAVFLVLQALQVLPELITMVWPINHLLLILLYLLSKERSNLNTYQPGMGMLTLRYPTFGKFITSQD